MSFAQFQQSVAGDPAPPAGLSAPLRALWLAGRGQWDAAHGAVQDDESRDAAWVHACLHREEGDVSNAHYWYARAGRPAAKGEVTAASLAAEREQIAKALLG